MAKIDRSLEGFSAERVLLGYGVLTLMAFLLAFLVGGKTNLTFFYLARQDRWLLSAGMLLLCAAVLTRRERSSPLRATWQLALALGIVMAACSFVGHFLILSGYDLSRDEQMASFDATVFARGHLVAPLPSLWRDHSDALGTWFMYPAEHRGAWISSYLPFNALIRAGLSLVASPDLSGPLMVLIGAIALWGCTRRIWPEDRETGAVALLLYLGSGQVLLSGMTSYAMPAHLALNLVWLWLFLRRAWWTDLAAVAIAFVAVGLHQPLMHPMFAAPLLVLLLIERDWRRAVFYALSYGAIGAFWLWWPGEMWRLVQASPNMPQPPGVDYMTRLAQVIVRPDQTDAVLMIDNLLRLTAWQPLLLLPLIGLAMPAIRRDRLATALAAGCAITLIVMAFILPFQGHGFGYRYLHGLLGNLFLLAIYGWKSIRSDLPRWRGLLVTATIGGVAILQPVQLAMSRAFYRPWAMVSNRINETDADYAIIGEYDVSLASDLIFNTPTLDRKPIRLLREKIDPAFAMRLCTTHPRVALASEELLSPIDLYFGVGNQSHPALPANQTFTPILQHAGCRIIPLN